MRKVLFADSDEDGSDGISNGSVREGEGEESRAEIRARQRSAVISQDKTEVKRRVAAKSVRRSLTEDPDVAVSLVVEMESKREEELKRRREAELAEVAAAKMSAANVQSMRKLQVWEWRQHVQSQQVWVRRFFWDGHGGGRGNVAGSAGCGESMKYVCSELCAYSLVSSALFSSGIDGVGMPCQTGFGMGAQ